MSELLDVQGAAKLLHISPNQLRLKVRNGEIRASKPANRWLFRLSDIEKFLDNTANIKKEAS